MPNIDPKDIANLITYMNDENDIGTLASSFISDKEIADINNVKVVVNDPLKNNQFDKAIDFRKDEKYEYFYHHVGIYAFTNKALVRYVSLSRSKLELERSWNN